MNEPSTDFEYPGGEDEEIVEAREQGRIQGGRLALRLLTEFVCRARNPKLRLAAFDYLGKPVAKSMRAIAKELGVSHMTVAREVATVRRFKLSPDVTGRPR